MKSTKNFLFLLHIIFIFNFITCEKNLPLFKCEHKNDEGINALPNRVAEISPKQKESQKRRINGEIDSEGYKDFNIHLDTKNILKNIEDKNLNAYKDFFIDSMNKVISAIKSLLKVKPLQEVYYVSDEDLTKLGLSAWDTEVFGTAAYNNGKTFQSQNIDLAIFAMLTDLGESTLASATANGFQRTETNKGQPYIGLVKININSKIDYSLPNAKEYLQTTLIHEFTHILGFSKHFFEEYYHNIVTKPDKFGISRSYLNSAKLLAVARKYYNCPTLDGVELENQGGNGTEASHWEARILLGEYMCGYSYSEEQVISEFTLAVLEDSGYYKANYYTGGLMRFGKHKGCAFLEEKCIDPTTHKTKEEFENEFFDSINPSMGFGASCSSGRQSRTYKIIHGVDDLKEEYKYFENSVWAGYEPADYCPVFLKNDDEEKKSYFSGHCSELGGGLYGSELYKQYQINMTSDYLKKWTGEKTSENSFCFLGSIIQPSIAQSDFLSNLVKASCYEIFCSDRSLTLKIFDDYIVCPRQGGKITVDGYKGYLLCPDYNLMCSGTVICNNIFDCIDKKSEIKDKEYSYDYEIKTTQNFDKLIAFSTDNYELSENGKCLQNCKQCKESNKCLKCRDDYGLQKEDNGDIKCYPNSTFAKGYYKDPETNIYEKCIDKCDECIDGETCEECSSGYININHHCVVNDDPSKIIDNCNEYDENKNCVKCKRNFAFNETNRETCYNIETQFSEYYTKDDGISYYPCSSQNPSCGKCTYDKDTSGINCHQCKEITFISKEGKFCSSKEEIESIPQYYLINNTHAGNCSEVINNCISCENENICTKCIEGYSLASNNQNTKKGCIAGENSNNSKEGVNSGKYLENFGLTFILKFLLPYVLLLLI